MILEATAVSAVVGMTAIGVHFTTDRGLLHWLSVWLLNVRAALLCLRWEIGKMPERWRQQYPSALNAVRRQG